MAVLRVWLFPGCNGTVAVVLSPLFCFHASSCMQHSPFGFVIVLVPPTVLGDSLQDSFSMTLAPNSAWQIVRTQ